MKNILFGLAIALLSFTSAFASADGYIKGHVNGMGANDSLLVVCNGAKEMIAAPNGIFHYKYTLDEAAIVRLVNPSKDKQQAGMSPITVMMFPGTTVSLKGDFRQYEVTGTPFYEEYNRWYEGVKTLDAKRQDMRAKYMELLFKKAPKSEIMSFFSKLKAIDVEFQKKTEEYIAQHLDSEVSLFLVCNVLPRYGSKYIDKFSAHVKGGAMKSMYAEAVAYYEKNEKRYQNASAVEPGKLAPDFTVKKLDGSDFTLSSLRGKYVVLDFWGSWCGWCIKGFPEMKKMYEKYKNKLEIVGVDCRDTEARWKAAVKKHQLPWINVTSMTNKNEDLVSTFNVNGFPTKVILSPEGKIVRAVVGESPEFYELIDRLMK